MSAQPENRGLVTNVGPLHVDVPRSVGYFGAVGLAVAFEVIEWPVGLFIAAIPFIKMLNRPTLPQPVRFVEHVLDGAAKPVGGDAEGTIRFNDQRPSDLMPSQPAAPEPSGGNGSRRKSASRRRAPASRRAPARSRR